MKTTNIKPANLHVSHPLVEYIKTLLDASSNTAYVSDETLTDAGVFSMSLSFHGITVETLGVARKKILPSHADRLETNVGEM